MRTYKKILDELNTLNNQYEFIKAELTALQKVCSHTSFTPHVSMCAGRISRWAACNDCGKSWGLPPQPGDLDEIIEDEVVSL